MCASLFGVGGVKFRQFLAVVLKFDNSRDIVGLLFAAAHVRADVTGEFFELFDSHSFELCFVERCRFVFGIVVDRNFGTRFGRVDVEIDDATLQAHVEYQLGALVKRFLRKVSAAGFLPMLYTNPNYLVYRFEPGAFADTPIWLAHWGVSKPYEGVYPEIWQFGVGRIDGIKTDVDHNYGYFSLDDKISRKYAVGDKYAIKAGDVYSDGREVPARLVGNEYTISQVRDDRILLRELVSWVKV